MKKFMVSFLLSIWLSMICLGLTVSFADTQKDAYEAIIQKNLDAAVQTEQVLQSWKNGCLRDFDLIVQKVIVGKFEINMIQDTPIPNVRVVIGDVTFIALAIDKNGKQKRIEIKTTMAITIQGNQIVQGQKIDAEPTCVLDGWIGTEI